MTSDPERALMPFGKHSGIPVADLPNGYLIWLTTEAEIRDPELREAVEDEGNWRVSVGKIKRSDLL